MSSIKQILTLEEIQTIISDEMAILVYFNTQSCSVGEAFLPKVDGLIKKYFPKIKIFTVDLNISSEISAYYNAFVEPTILVFFDGKETIRKSRNFGMYELEDAIKRPYQLIFE